MKNVDNRHNLIMFEGADKIRSRQKQCKVELLGKV